MTWTVPISHIDSEGTWSDASNAYDENLATYSANAWTDRGDYLELLFSSVWSDKLRLKAGQLDPNNFTLEIEIDVYEELGEHWSSVTVGIVLNDVLTTLSFTAQFCSRVRIKSIQNNDIPTWLYELDVWSIAGFVG